MEIKKITENKEQFMDFLIVGDEQENMIRKYLDRGDLFALYAPDLKTVCVVTQEDEKTCEIKNLATYEGEQGKGYGNAMMKHVIEYCKGKCDTLQLGTGDVEEIISYYSKFGFAYSHTVKDFFVDNCDHEMFENGKQLRDMIYLKLSFL